MKFKFTEKSDFMETVLWVYILILCGPKDGNYFNATPVLFHFPEFVPAH
jgi:hypothetical protein